MKLKYFLTALTILVILLIGGLLISKPANAANFDGKIDVPCSDDRIAFVAGMYEQGFYIETVKDVKVGTGMETSQLMTIVHTSKKIRLSTVSNSRAICIVIAEYFAKDSDVLGNYKK
jgi:hypothetical protein